MKRPSAAARRSGRKPSLAGRITVSYTLILALTTLTVLGGLGVYLQWKTERDLETEGRRLAVWLSDVVAEPVWNFDLAQLRITAGGLVVHSAVDSITIVDPEKRVLLEAGASPPGARVFERPIVRNGHALGTLALTVSLKNLGPGDGLFSWGALAFGSLIVALVLISPFLFRRLARAPLTELSNLVDRYARGEYRSLDELSMRYQEFDTISEALSGMGRTIREQMERWRQLNDHLELAVAERTQDLERTLVNLRHTQDSLIRSEKLASLGKLVAVFAHELNTPLGVVTSSAQTLDQLNRELAGALGLDQRMPAGLVSESIERARDLTATPTRAELREWRRARSTASPEAFELVSRLVEDYGLWPLREELLATSARTSFASLKNLEILCATARSVALTASAAQRAAGVVKALRVYLKEETEGRPTEFDPAAELDRILVLLGTKLRGGIQVVREYEPGLRAWGNTEALSQVWMNLVVNALYVLDRKGTLTLRTRPRRGGTVIEVEDSGPGIPPDIRERIFEPFFTTKREGEGMGLGLDICRHIVEAQGGSIGFDSEPGRTVFRVELPSP